MADTITWYPFGPFKSYRHMNKISGNNLRTVATRNLAYGVSNMRVEQTPGTLVFQAAITEDNRGRVKARSYSGGQAGLQASNFLYDKLDRVTCEQTGTDSTCILGKAKNWHDATPPCLALSSFLDRERCRGTSISRTVSIRSKLHMLKRAAFRTFLAFVPACACGGSAQHAAMPELPELTIALSQPGAEPRQRLRYEPTPNAPERMGLDMKLHIETAFINTALETVRRSVDLPTARITGRFEVTALTGTGNAVMTFEVEDAAVLDDSIDPDPAIRKEVETEIGALKGLRASWRVSPSGIHSDFRVDTTQASRSARHQLYDLGRTIRDASVVFPEAEIGIGATWQVTSRQSISGVTWNRTVTYRLRDLAGTTATVDSEIVMRAPSQVLTVEPNSSVSLTSGTTNVAGELAIPLRGLVATSVSREASEMNFSIVRGRQRTTSTVQTETLFSIKPLGTESPDTQP